MERRGFLKLLGLGAVSAVAAPKVLPELLRAPAVVPAEVAPPVRMLTTRLIISQEMCDDFCISPSDLVSMQLQEARDLQEARLFLDG